MATLLLATVSCDGTEPPPPPTPVGSWLGITAQSTAVSPDYGALVPMRFTVQNFGSGTCWLQRLEGLVGGRWEMWTGPQGGAPIPAGGSISVEISYRLLTTEEDVLLSYERPDPRKPGTRSGQVVMERSKVAIACPEEPFDPRRLERRYDSWTFSTALDGFIFRGNEWTYTLVRRDGGSTLPPLPFRFLKEIDLLPEGVTVLMDNEEIRVVTAPELREFLAQLQDRRAHVVESREPDKAEYEVLR